MCKSIYLHGQFDTVKHKNNPIVPLITITESFDPYLFPREILDKIIQIK